MRKLSLTLSVLCTLALAFVYAFGAYLTWFWQKFGDASQVRTDVRMYLLIGAIFFAGLYLARKMIGIILLILAVVLLVLFFQFDILQILNIVR